MTVLGIPASEFAVLVLAIVIAGALTGIFAGLLGIGGAAISVPVMYEVFRALGVADEVRIQLCVGTALALIVPTSIRSYFAHKAKGAVDDKVLKIWAIPIIAGVAVGSVIAYFASATVFKLLFVVFASLMALKLLFGRENWGLVVYDEVHLLPAPVFRVTAEIQARRRLGLTATLVREDGRESDVFSLIGPKRFDAPWKEIEAQGYISPATCFEVRVDLPADDRMEYAASADDDRYRLAATAPAKLRVVKDLVAKHHGERILVIGQYLDQIEELSAALDAPSLTGSTPVEERERLYQAFRDGTLKVLVVSKVANFSVDLPEATVAIQVSGSFGSRQEEAQRLGRLLRPKESGIPASFYTLVARDTVDQDFAQNRQRFLAEQGYSYTILDASALAA